MYVNIDLYVVIDIVIKTISKYNYFSTIVVYITWYLIYYITNKYSYTII